MSHNHTLMWFSHDLRLDDNRTLFRAIQSAETLLCVFFVDPEWFKPQRYGTVGMGQHRRRFFKESLSSLDQHLRRLGQRLIVLHQSPSAALPQLVEAFSIGQVYRSAHVTTDERRVWQALKLSLPSVQFEETHTHSLFEPSELPFDVTQLPDTFSRFRRKAEKLPIAEPMAKPQWLPPPPPDIERNLDTITMKISPLPQVRTLPDDIEYPIRLRGGESAARVHLIDYFSGELPARYKLVRNELDGWPNSTKFSAWLANGCLSVRRLLAELKRYEDEVTANDSTYWIYFELLWREYFQWYALCHDSRLFKFRGLGVTGPLTSYYPERFQKWCAGETLYPIVNASMKQLNATGYLSNRGRQLVASCLVNELQVDWRYGAAYLEQQLIDYDPAANWGNWQYIAGVGADPKGGRHFNLQKQTEIYDPQHTYIHRWGGNSSLQPADSVDCADWPVAAVEASK